MYVLLPYFMYVLDLEINNLLQTSGHGIPGEYHKNLEAFAHLGYQNHGYNGSNPHLNSYTTMAITKYANNTTPKSIKRFVESNNLTALFNSVLQNILFVDRESFLLSPSSTLFPVCFSFFLFLDGNFRSNSRSILLSF